jgi:hypothetical protein
MKTCRICSTPYSSSRQDLSFHWYVLLGAWNFGQQFMLFKKKQCNLSFIVINVIIINFD